MCTGCLCSITGRNTTLCKNSFCASSLVFKGCVSLTLSMSHSKSTCHFVFELVLHAQLDAGGAAHYEDDQLSAAMLGKPTMTWPDSSFARSSAPAWVSTMPSNCCQTLKTTASITCS